MINGETDMAIMLRLRILSVLCAAVAGLALGAGAASAAPMGADTLKHGSPSSDVVQVFDPDQREYTRRQRADNRRRSAWRSSPAFRHYQARHVRVARYMRAHRGRR
jgi:hypothetical protein